MMFGLFAMLVTLFSTVGTASAQSLTLEQDFLYIDRPGWSQSSYWMGGYQSGDTYSFYADYFLVDEEVAYTYLYVSYTDDNWNTYTDLDERWNIVGDSDSVMLGAAVTLPPASSGTLYVEFLIEFADGTYVIDYRYVTLP